MIRSFVLLLPLLLFTGCYNKLVPKNVQLYEIGKIAEATVGSPILSKQTQTIEKGSKWVGVAFSESGYEERLRTFKEELLYSGKSGSEIKLTYREYLDGLARSSFYQDLQYDLEESKEIAFKHYKIEVIDANNSKITFKVLAH
jgi:hypothetical protein